MLVLPSLLAFGEAVAFSWVWWWVGNLGNEIRRTCFRDAVDENAELWDSQEDIKANSKSEQKTFAVMEPMLLLLGGEFYAAEVWLKELTHERARSEV